MRACTDIGKSERVVDANSHYTEKLYLQIAISYNAVTLKIHNMKKWFLLAIVAVFLLLFWSPWLQHENGENVVKDFQRNMSAEQRAEIDVATSIHACSISMTPDCCDGLVSSWAPFGRTIGYCDYVTWYVSSIPFVGDL